MKQFLRGLGNINVAACLESRGQSLWLLTSSSRSRPLVVTSIWHFRKQLGSSNPHRHLHHHHVTIVPLIYSPSSSSSWIMAARYPLSLRRYTVLENTVEIKVRIYWLRQTGGDKLLYVYVIMKASPGFRLTIRLLLLPSNAQAFL